MVLKRKCIAICYIILNILFLPLYFDNARTTAYSETKVIQVESIELSHQTQTLKFGNSLSIKATIMPKNASNKQLSWASSDEQVATVSNKGVVKAVGLGDCIITCNTEDGSSITEQCAISVVKTIKSIKFEKREMSITISETIVLKPNILPEDASNKFLIWSSSKPEVASVSKLGRVHGVSSGETTISCTSQDGSKIKASIRIKVSAFAAPEKEYILKSRKEPLKIPVIYKGFDTVHANYSSHNFDVEWADEQSGNTMYLIVSPNRAGKGTIKVFEENNKNSSITINIVVDQSAAYSEKSFPKMVYESVARYPQSYNGDFVSVRGKVLQVSDNGGERILRVASRGGYRDIVYAVIPETVNTMGNVLEDDTITMYGVCTGVETYTTIMGASVTIPSMRVEKIIFH